MFTVCKLGPQERERGGSCERGGHVGRVLREEPGGAGPLDRCELPPRGKGRGTTSGTALVAVCVFYCERFPD